MAFIHFLNFLSYELTNVTPSRTAFALDFTFSTADEIALFLAETASDLISDDINR